MKWTLKKFHAMSGLALKLSEYGHWSQYEHGWKSKEKCDKDYNCEYQEIECAEVGSRKSSRQMIMRTSLLNTIMKIMGTALI